MAPDVVGIPLFEAERRLKEAGANYHVEVTRPVRGYFKIDETRLYGIRECVRDDVVSLTVACKQVRKEVS